MNDLGVWRSNRLVQASYKLTLAEYRCMWQVLSRIYMKDGISPDTLYSIDLDDYATTWNISRNQAYIDVNKGLKQLINRTVTVRTKDILELEGNKSTEPIKWVDKIVLSKEGVPAIKWNASVIPYLMSANKFFTRLRMDSLIKLRKFSYIRLYEVLKQYEMISHRTLSVEELQDILDIDRTYKTFGHLNSRKIEPAIKAINEYTEIGVSYDKKDYKKAGKRVVSIKFHITRWEKKLEETNTKEIQELTKGHDYTNINIGGFKGRPTKTKTN